MTCTGLRCSHRECRARRKARLRREWEAREAKRPPLADRLNAMFKEIFGDRIATMFPRGWKMMEAFLTPEQRAEAHAERQREKEERWARLPKVVLQDDKWRSRMVR